MRKTFITSVLLPFDSQQEFEYHYPVPWAYPAREFELQTGMTGIAGYWKMPDGFAEKNIDQIIFNAASIWELQLLAKEMVKVNEGLGSINFDCNNLEHVINFLRGVTSGFSAEDIEYYIWRTDERIKRDVKECGLLEAEVGGDIGWAPAPSTRAEIRNYFASEVFTVDLTPLS